LLYTTIYIINMDGPILFIGDSFELGKSSLSVYERRRFVINYKTADGVYINVVIFNMRKIVPLNLYKTISEDLSTGFGVEIVNNGVNIVEFRNAAHKYLNNINKQTRR
jgi:hypothetical protein